ncbi:MAG: hypothetical protein D8M58_15990 [Calditrichaeota bacterium]|nr:MAG: hypothetical protein DWQ03_07720 [Calditrichota bacterium]MBL1206906.1 hypothetical protein [Calditrichota bacterium]NOG46732.1 hypothetical protein [Calditrichota bacterium]
MPNSITKISIGDAELIDSVSFSPLTEEPIKLELNVDGEELTMVIEHISDQNDPKKRWEVSFEDDTPEIIIFRLVNIKINEKGYTIEPVPLWKSDYSKVFLKFDKSYNQSNTPSNINLSFYLIRQGEKNG